MTNKDLSYGEVMDKAHNLAETEGKAVPDTAWLYLEEGYYWPNPFYKGVPVRHPEDNSDKGAQYHPPKPGLSDIQRLKAKVLAKQAKK